LSLPTTTSSAIPIPIASLFQSAPEILLAKLQVFPDMSCPRRPHQLDSQANPQFCSSGISILSLFAGWMLAGHAPVKRHFVRSTVLVSSDTLITVFSSFCVIVATL
jgi:hypothetical protein